MKQLKILAKILFTFLMIMAVTFTAGIASADGHEENGTVTIGHGVPGLVVDVYVNGDLFLPGFQPFKKFGPVELPADDYHVVIVAEGGDPNSPVIEGMVTLPADVNATIIANLAADGTPGLTVFVNDVSPILDGQARAVVRHTAAAPAVDILLFDRDDNLVAEFENLSNPNEVMADIDYGKYKVGITAAGDDTLVFGPEKLPLKANQATIFYAVGSLADGTFRLVKQVIPLPVIETGTVTVLHGIPGVVVDVYVNGGLFLPSFAPGTVTDPVTLPEGNYDIAIVAESGDPASPILSSATFLPSGANVSIIAHLAADGMPTLSVFANDASAVAAGDTRVVLRHTAAAPAVDIALFNAPHSSPFAVIENLSNPDEAQADIPKGEYQATISPAGSDMPVFGPASLHLPNKTATIVYAIGSLSDGTFDLLVQIIDLR